MPFGDNTGPMGAGPMTGRGLGFCNGFDAPGAYRGGGRMGGRMRGGWRAGSFGRGFGVGMGRGAGWRHRFWQPVDPDDTLLAGRIEMLEAELKAAREQLARIQEQRAGEAEPES